MFFLEARKSVWERDLTKPKSLAEEACRISSICTRSASGLVSIDCVRIAYFPLLIRF